MTLIPSSLPLPPHKRFLACGSLATYAESGPPTPPVPSARRQGRPGTIEREPAAAVQSEPRSLELAFKIREGVAAGWHCRLPGSQDLMLLGVGAVRSPWKAKSRSCSVTSLTALGSKSASRRGRPETDWKPGVMSVDKESVVCATSVWQCAG